MNRAATRLTLERYHEMIREGRFEPVEAHHIELLHGEIVPMSPIGPAHDDVLAEVTEWSYEALPARAARIIVQGALTIPEYDSEPEPDLLWARRRDYRARHPAPADVLLVVEVADSSLARDRGIKSRLYAASGIAEYWIVNLAAGCVEVHRDPDQAAGEYRTVEVARPGQVVHPLAHPPAALPVSRLFPD